MQHRQESEGHRSIHLFFARDGRRVVKSGVEWSGVAARTRDARSVLQNETLEVAIVPEGLLHNRQLLVVPHAITILEGILHLVAEALGVVPRLLRDRETMPHPRPL